VKRLLAGGTTRQIAAIVITALLAAHAMTGAILWSVDTRPGPPPGFVETASRIGLVLRLLQALPANDGATILAAASGGGFSVREGAGDPPVLDDAGEPGAGGLRQAVEQALGPGPQLLAVGR
jgi:hypothetical protein